MINIIMYSATLCYDWISDTGYFYYSYEYRWLERNIGTSSWNKNQKRESIFSGKTVYIPWKEEIGAYAMKHLVADAHLLKLSRFLS